MKVKTNDCVMALALLAVSGIFYYQTTTLHPVVVYAFGPVFFPRIALGMVVLCSLILLWQSVKAPAVRPGIAAPDGKAAKAAAPWPWRVMLVRWSLVGLTILYLLALRLGGYTVTTILFLFAAMCLLGPRTPRSLAKYGAISVLFTLALYYIFASLLKLFLP